MSPSARVLFLVGAVAIVVALVLAVLLRGMEYASWVAGSIGALALASGLVTRLFSPSTSGGGSDGDRIEQSELKAQGSITGKRGGQGQGDQIRQTRLEAGGDIIGKQSGPDAG